MKYLRFAAVLAILFAATVPARMSSATGGQQTKTAKPQKEQTHKIPASAKVWKSQTSGKEYAVWEEGKNLHAEWVGILPQFAAKGAYISSVLHREGSKWVGESHSYLPCSMGQGAEEHIANWCHITTGIEIDSMSDNRITGRGEALKRFDCKTCKVLEKEWKDFVWVPKTGK